MIPAPGTRDEHGFPQTPARSKIGLGILKAEAAIWVFVAAAFLAGGATGILFFHTRYITQNHTITKSPYTHPVQTIPGEQVNAALKGATCRVYQSPAALVCS